MIGIILGILIVHTLFLAEIWLKSDSGALKLFHNKAKEIIKQPEGFVVMPKTSREEAIEHLDKTANPLEGTKYEELI